jgi:hypothetical protein
MPSAGFETAIPAKKRLQTYALDRAATGIDLDSLLQMLINETRFSKQVDIGYN